MRTSSVDLALRTATLSEHVCFADPFLHGKMRSIGRMIMIGLLAPHIVPGSALTQYRNWPSSSSVIPTASPRNAGGIFGVRGGGQFVGSMQAIAIVGDNKKTKSESIRFRIVILYQKYRFCTIIKALPAPLPYKGLPLPGLSVKAGGFSKRLVLLWLRLLNLIFWAVQSFCLLFICARCI